MPDVELKFLYLLMILPKSIISNYSIKFFLLQFHLLIQKKSFHQKLSFVFWLLHILDDLQDPDSKLFLLDHVYISIPQLFRHFYNVFPYEFQKFLILEEYNMLLEVLIQNLSYLLVLPIGFDLLILDL